MAVSPTVSEFSTEASSPSSAVVRRRGLLHAKELEPEFDDTVAPTMAGVTQDPNPGKMPNGQLKNFLWTTSPQPHPIRRRQILDKYPQIEQLYGSDPSQCVLVFVTLAAQFIIAYYMSVVRMSWLAYLFLAFFVSGTLNHSLFAAMHEASHRTIFSGKFASELFCIILSLPMGLPVAIPFKRYHLDHHIYLGVDRLDPDLPVFEEAWFFHSTWRKILWVFMFPFTYSLRPVLVRPKSVVPMDIVNWILQIGLDVLVLRYWGFKALGYFILGTFFSMNFHPFSGHFIAEHFIFPDDDPYQETHSYYGPWNLLTYNLGYHNEHHDFPRVPGSRLPIVTSIAKEFYDMPQHYGWLRVLWGFLSTPTMTPFNRVKRVALNGGALDPANANMKLHSGDIPNGGNKKFWPKIK